MPGVGRHVPIASVGETLGYCLVLVKLQGSLLLPGIGEILQMVHWLVRNSVFSVPGGLSKFTGKIPVHRRFLKLGRYR